jgi:hypothetical protein
MPTPLDSFLDSYTPGSLPSPDGGIGDFLDAYQPGMIPGPHQENIDAALQQLIAGGGDYQIDKAAAAIPGAGFLVRGIQGMAQRRNYDQALARVEAGTPEEGDYFTLARPLHREYMEGRYQETNKNLPWFIPNPEAAMRTANFAGAMAVNPLLAVGAEAVAASGERMAPYVDRTGQVQTMNPALAVASGTADAAIEVGTEMLSGKVLGVAQQFVKVNPRGNVKQLLDFARTTGQGDILSEIGEERVAEVLTAAKDQLLQDDRANYGVTGDALQYARGDQEAGERAMRGLKEEVAQFAPLTAAGGLVATSAAMDRRGQHAAAVAQRANVQTQRQQNDSYWATPTVAESMSRQLPPQVVQEIAATERPSSAQFERWGLGTRRENTIPGQDTRAAFAANVKALLAQQQETTNANDPQRAAASGDGSMGGRAGESANPDPQQPAPGQPPIDTRRWKVYGGERIGPYNESTPATSRQLAATEPFAPPAVTEEMESGVPGEPQPQEHPNAKELRNEAEAQGEVEKPYRPLRKPAAAPDVRESAPGGEGAALPPVGQQLDGLNVQEFPVSRIELSEDVPQFKENANDEGVVEPLQGESYRRTPANPIVVWERTNGRYEVITGRHRLALAKRLGEATIPTQIVREADGFTREQALILDAESNILDEKGAVRDYATYFRFRKLSQEEADAKGLRGNVKGRHGFALGKYAEDNLYGAWRNGRITDAKAAAIAEAAPNNDGLQTAALAHAKGLSPDELTSLVRQMASRATTRKQVQGDMFGFDDSDMREMAERSKAAEKIRQQIKDRILAVKGAIRRPDQAKQMGLSGDMKAVQAEVQKLEGELAAWEKWFTDPELGRQVDEALRKDRPLLVGLEDSGEIQNAAMGKSKYRPLRKTKASPTIHHTDVAAAPEQPSTQGAMAQWALQPAETDAGRALLEKIQNDSKSSPTVGLRTISQVLVDGVHAVLYVTRRQTTRRNPAHFMRRGALIRSRSGTWNLNFHEAGHALSAWVRDTHPGWVAEIAEALEAFAKVTPHASAHTTEEGLAELVRLYVKDQARIPAVLRNKFEALLGSAKPEALQLLRDIHRAYHTHLARPLSEQRKAAINDRSKPKAGQKVSDWAYLSLRNLIGNGQVIHYLKKKVYRSIGGDTAITNWDPTGIIGTVREWASPEYRAQQALAERWRSRILDTTGDIESAYHATIHAAGEAMRALGGMRGSGEGISFKVWGQGLLQAIRGDFTPPEGLTPNDKARWKEAEAAHIGEIKQWFAEHGIDVAEIVSKHGHYQTVFEKSLASIKEDVGVENWEDFSAAVQWSAALERHKRRGHDYPLMRDGMEPQVLEQEVERIWQEHPEWKQPRADLERMFKSLLLLPLASGEKTLSEVKKLIESYEHYAPLFRQAEDGRGRGGNRNAAPRSLIRKAFGADQPFVPLEQAITTRVMNDFKAYYDNLFLKTLLKFSQSTSRMKDVDYDTRKMVERTMVPLHLERKMVAKLRPDEMHKIMADGINRKMLEDMGYSPSGMSPDDVVEALEKAGEEPANPDTLQIAGPGFKVFRDVKPGGHNVVELWENGQKHYYWIPDPVTFSMFTTNATPEWLRHATGIIKASGDPMRRAIVQTWVFALRNVERDPLTAIVNRSTLERKSGKARSKADVAADYVPGFLHAYKVVSRLLGQSGDSKAAAELTAKALDHLTQDAHKTLVEQFVDMLKEGVYHPGFFQMTPMEQVKAATSTFFAAMTKPADVVNFVLGSRHFSAYSETAAREGAFELALNEELSPARAQVDYDTVTGFFAQKPGNEWWAAFTTAVPFLNPTLQVVGQSIQRHTHFSNRTRLAAFRVHVEKIAKLGAGLAALNYLLILMIYDDEEKEEIFKRIQEQPEQEALTHAAIGGKIRVPFGYGPEGAVMSMGYNLTQNALMGSKSDAKSMAATLAAEAAVPFGLQDMIPPAPKALYELYSNRSMYFDEEIIPHEMLERYPNNPELQVYYNTPDVYRKIGAGVGVSPLQVRHAVRSGMSSLIDDAVAFIDRTGKGAAKETDVPLLKSLLVKDPTVHSSRSVKSLRELDRDYGAVHDYLAANAKTPEEQRRLVQLEKAHRVWLEVERMRDKIRDERASGVPDYDKIAQWERDIITTARTFIQTNKIDDLVKHNAVQREQAIRNPYRNPLRPERNETPKTFQDRQRKAVDEFQEAQRILSSIREDE